MKKDKTKTEVPFCYFCFYLDYVDSKHGEFQVGYPEWKKKKYLKLKVNIDDPMFSDLLEHSFEMRGWLGLDGYHFDWCPDLGKYLNYKDFIMSELTKLADLIPKLTSQITEDAVIEFRDSL